MLTVRLYRPFAAAAFVATLPATALRVGVLDRCKEPGSLGEPLFQDVVTALAERGGTMPLVAGGRYGLASKEFTPAMAAAVFAHLAEPEPRRRFTVGIVDDVSHLRFGPRPIGSSYLVESAGFVACHQFGLLDQIDVLAVAAEGATFLLNAPYGPDEVWERLPAGVQEQIVAKRLRLFVVDATRVAQEAGMGRRVNTVLQTCFFALSGVLPLDRAIVAIKDAIRRTYGKRGQVVLDRNEAAVDSALDGLREVAVPAAVTAVATVAPPVADVPDVAARVTAAMLAGRGDTLPVSALPVDGTFPVGTARYSEERSSRTADLPRVEMSYIGG